MNNRERIAHHEAAHAVLAHKLGSGVLPEGINIDAPSSAPGATGNARVNIFGPVEDADKQEQMGRALHSVAIIYAGIASDAKILGMPLKDARAQQPGDATCAEEFLSNHPVLDAPEELAPLLDIFLEHTAELLEKPEVWGDIQKVAQACIGAGGRLSKDEIEKLIIDAAPASGPPKAN